MEKNNLELELRKSILIILSIFALIIFITFLFFEKFMIDNEFKKEVLTSSSINILKKEKQLNKLLKDTKKSLTSISQLEDFKTAIKNKNYNKLEKIFFTISQSNSFYMQIRFLDKFGKEKVRVDREIHNDDSIIKKEIEFQDKSKRDYFIESKNSKDFYISNLDLNIENEQVEYPYKPTLRVVLPIFDKNNFIGELVVNLEINLLFDTTLFDIMITNLKAKVILPFDKNEKNFDKRLEYYFQNSYKNIIKNKIYVFDNMISYKLDTEVKDGIILVLKLRDEHLSVFQKHQLKFKVILFGILFLVILIMIFIVTKRLNHIILYYNKLILEEKIKNSNKELDSAHTYLSKSIDPELILSQSSTSMILTNNRLEILFVNKAFTNLFGYNEDEVVNKYPGFLRNEDLEQPGIAKLNEALKNQIAITVLLRNYTKNGKLKYIELSVSPIYKENSNELVYYLGIQKDVTKEQKILNDLKKIF